MGRKLDKHTCMKCGRLVSVKSRYARVVLREHICRPDADLTFPQLATLKELSEPNGNPENEWRMARRGPLAACRTLNDLALPSRFQKKVTTSLPLPILGASCWLVYRNGHQPDRHALFEGRRGWIIHAYPVHAHH